jgi:hypothetical protein
MHSPKGMHASLTRSFRWFEGTLTLRLALSASLRISREIVGRIVCLFRREITFKRISFHLTSTNIHQGHFAPSALPDFNTTIAPSDFPSGSPRLFIPVFDWTRSNCNHRPVRHLGPPKFLTQLSMPAVPSHPGLPSDCLHLLLHR